MSFITHEGQHGMLYKDPMGSIRDDCQTGYKAQGDAFSRVNATALF